MAKTLGGKNWKIICTKSFHPEYFSSSCINQKKNQQYFICFQVVFRASGHVHEGHNITVDLNVSPDRQQVTCSVGGGCARCSQDDKIMLDVEGNKKAFQ